MPNAMKKTICLFPINGKPCNQDMSDWTWEKMTEHVTKHMREKKQKEENDRCQKRIDGFD